MINPSVRPPVRLEFTQTVPLRRIENLEFTNLSDACAMANALAGSIDHTVRELVRLYERNGHVQVYGDYGYATVYFEGEINENP